MQLTRLEALQSLSDEESVKLHNLSAAELQSLSNDALAIIVNLIFEPIDLSDPYNVVTFEQESPACSH